MSAEPTTPEPTDDDTPATKPRGPIKVPTTSDLWGAPEDPVIAEDAAAASHWDCRAWNRGLPT